MDELRAELICTKNVYLGICEDVEESKQFKKDEIVKCKIQDRGIRLEYKPNYYTDIYRPSIISRFFKIKG